jgi:hypothetical protein
MPLQNSFSRLYCRFCRLLGILFSGTLFMSGTLHFDADSRVFQAFFAVFVL